ISYHSSQQIVEIMGNAPSQLADDFELLRLMEAFLDLPPFGYIPDRPGKPKRIAMRIAIHPTFGDEPPQLVLSIHRPKLQAEFSALHRLLNPPPDQSLFLRKHPAPEGNDPVIKQRAEFLVSRLV